MIIKFFLQDLRTVFINLDNVYEIQTIHQTKYIVKTFQGNFIFEKKPDVSDNLFWDIFNCFRMFPEIGMFSVKNKLEPNGFNCSFNISFEAEKK